jgi:hypothetical protein
MTQEQKDLLLKDLCARLPYGVKGLVTFNGNHFMTQHQVEDRTIDGKLYDRFAEFQDSWYDNVTIKPYLFPLSSMTVEQKNSFPFSYSFLEALIDDGVYFDEDECITLNDMIYVIQWCYKNHFDIYGLIPMGLANDATGLNIYAK